MGTIIVGLIVLAAIIMAIRSLIKNQGGCGCGCSGCSSSCSKCHPASVNGIKKLVKESKTHHAS